MPAASPRSGGSASACWTTSSVVTKSILYARRSASQSQYPPPPPLTLLGVSIGMESGCCTDLQHREWLKVRAAPEKTQANRELGGAGGGLVRPGRLPYPSAPICDLVWMPEYSVHLLSARAGRARLFRRHSNSISMLLAPPISKIIRHDSLVRTRRNTSPIRPSAPSPGPCSTITSESPRCVSSPLSCPAKAPFAALATLCACLRPWLSSQWACRSLLTSHGGSFAVQLPGDREDQR